MFSSMATKFQMTFRKASWFFSWIAKLGDSWLFMPCSSILCLLSNLALFSGWTAWQKLQAVPGYPKFPASVEVHAQETLSWPVSDALQYSSISANTMRQIFCSFPLWPLDSILKNTETCWVRWASNPWVVDCLYSKTTSQESPPNDRWHSDPAGSACRDVGTPHSVTLNSPG